MAIIVLIVNKLNNNESSSLSFVKQYLPTFCKRHIFAYSDRLLLRNIHHVRKIAIYQNPLIIEEMKIPNRLFVSFRCPFAWRY